MNRVELMMPINDIDNTDCRIRPLLLVLHTMYNICTTAHYTLLGSRSEWLKDDNGFMFKK